MQAHPPPVLYKRADGTWTEKRSYLVGPSSHTAARPATTVHVPRLSFTGMGSGVGSGVSREHRFYPSSKTARAPPSSTSERGGGNKQPQSEGLLPAIAAPPSRTEKSQKRRPASARLEQTAWSDDLHWFEENKKVLDEERELNERLTRKMTKRKSRTLKRHPSRALQFRAARAVSELNMYDLAKHVISGSSLPTIIEAFQNLHPSSATSPLAPTGLSLNDFRRLLTGLVPEKVVQENEDDIIHFFQGCDLDCNGEVSLSEFIGIMGQLMLSPSLDTRIQAFFNELDRSGTGRVAVATLMSNSILQAVLGGSPEWAQVIRAVPTQTMKYFDESAEHCATLDEFRCLVYLDMHCIYCFEAARME